MFLSIRLGKIKGRPPFKETKLSFLENETFFKTYCLLTLDMKDL